MTNLQLGNISFYPYKLTLSEQFELELKKFNPLKLETQFFGEGLQNFHEQEQLK